MRNSHFRAPMYKIRSIKTVSEVFSISEFPFLGPKMYKIWSKKLPPGFRIYSFRAAVSPSARPPQNSGLRPSFAPLEIKILIKLKSVFVDRFWRMIPFFHSKSNFQKVCKGTVFRFLTRSKNPVPGNRKTGFISGDVERKFCSMAHFKDHPMG